MPHVLDLAECAGVPAKRIGGKALGLGRLFAQSLEVPPGFVVTTDAYRAWMQANEFEAEIEGLLARTNDVDAVQAAAHAIDAMLTAVALASDEIDAAYARLTAHGGAEPPVAVRSSATAEDGEAASFAGAQDTHLWIRGAADVRRHVVRCWASLFTPAAISYRARLGLGHVGHAMAVVVQEMVDAQSAGVMFSLDPLTGDPSQITIESTFGLGLPLVGGEITPDRFCLDKITFEIRSRAIAVKPFADRLVDGRIQRVALDDETGRSSSLSDGEALTLARVARQVEQARQGSVDMEWAIGPGPSGARHVYLLQARPETVWSGSSESSSIATTPASTASGALGRIALGLRRTSP